jgi:hypothetical protein
MTPLTFAALLLLQRADEALRLQRLSSRPNPLRLALLQRQKRSLSERLQRSLGSHHLTGD